MADYAQLMNLEKKKKEKTPSPVVTAPTPPVEPKSQNTRSQDPKTRTGQDFNASSGHRVIARTPEDLIGSSGHHLNGSRVIKRHSYEFYKDQIEAIQRLSLQDKINGGAGNQSQMVRNALDEYLQKIQKK